MKYLPSFLSFLLLQVGVLATEYEPLPQSMFQRFTNSQCPTLGEVLKLSSAEEKQEATLWITELFYQFSERCEHYGDTAAEVWLKEQALTVLCERLAANYVSSGKVAAAKEALAEAAAKLIETKNEFNRHRIIALEEELEARKARLNQTEAQSKAAVADKVQELIEEAGG